MPHIRFMMAQADARLTAMKLYAYRAADYVQASSADDRRYLLYCAVQKARVSTEGVKVIALLSECIGAKGFESDTYFEMALRDVQLIPGLEGSTHINFALTAQFLAQYFHHPHRSLCDPPSISASADAMGVAENEYLMAAKTDHPNVVAFTHHLSAYQPLMSIPNVRMFTRQIRLFRAAARAMRAGGRDASDVHGEI